MADPRKYAKAMDEQAFRLCLLGATVDQLAEFFEVHRATIFKWQKLHESFADAVRRGKAEADAKVAHALYRRAIGFEKEGKYYPPEVVAAIFWLKNRARDRWRDRQDHEGNHNHNVVDLTDEELARIATGGGKRAAEKKDGPGTVH